VVDPNALSPMLLRNSPKEIQLSVDTLNPGQDVPCGRGRGDYRVGLSATCGWDFQKGLAASLTHGESWLKIEAGGEGVSYGHAA
jgi:hypothetical protein